jgi:dolichol-phosphate mannosyltransferase
MGLIIGIIGIIDAIYTVIDRIVNNTPAGWASIMVVVLITSSFQMIMMGLLGEYLWRNLDETRKRPLYVIEKIQSRNEEGIKTARTVDLYLKEMNDYDK